MSERGLEPNYLLNEDWQEINMKIYIRYNDVKYFFKNTGNKRLATRLAGFGESFE